MSSFMDPSLILALIGGVVLSQTSIMVTRRRVALQKRTEELERAAELLSIHNDHTAKFLDDVAAPDFLKDALVDFGDAIDMPEVAHEYAVIVKNKSKVENSEASKQIAAALNALRGHRTDLAQSFEVAVNTGVVAMLLRWPETAKIFEEAIARAASEPSNVTLVTRVSKSNNASSPLEGIRSRREQVLA